MTQLEQFIETQMLDPASMFRYGAWVDEQARTIYFENPKVACTKIKRVLLQLGGHSLPSPAWRIHERTGLGRRAPGDLSNLSTTQIHRRLTNSEWFTFSFVRNPYDRLVSGYRSKVESSLEGYAPFRSEVAEATGSPSDSIAFADFVRFVCEQDDDQRDTHWRTQSALLRPDLIDLDYVGRFEEFATGFGSVINHRWPDTQPPEPLEKRVNSTSSASWRDAYNDELAEIVGDAYQSDFANFGYQKTSWRS